jgi:hypothetical protein
MAVFSGSVFMMAPEPSFSDYMGFTLDADWSQYSQYFSSSTTCSVSLDKLASSDMQWCDGPVNATIRAYSSIDYDAPMLQMSPTVGKRLRQLVPAGNIFHEVSKFLLRPTTLLSTAVERYQGQYKDCLVGMHVRTRKPYPGEEAGYIVPQNYASAARSISSGVAGSVFLASDGPVFQEIASLLPERQVWWTNETQTSITTANGVGNPGSDLSAFMDIIVLSHCKFIVLTSGSSFAPVAAGLSDTHPMYVVRGQHAQPFYSPRWWVAPTSEPCMWQGSRIYGTDVLNATKQVLQLHPLLSFFEQCA